MNKNSILKSFLTLMSGSMLAQLIPILISPFLTRIFTTSDFGKFAIFTAIFSICSSLSNGKYSSSILLPKDNNILTPLVCLNILISIVFSLSLFALIYFNSQFEFYEIDLSISFQLIIPIVVFIASFQQVYLMIANREENYKLMAVTKTSQSLINSVLNICLGYMSFGVSGLIYSRLVAFFFSTFYLFKFISFKIKQKYFSFKSLKLIAKKYIDFPLYTLPQSLLYQLVIQIPIFFIQDVYSVYLLGLYALTRRVFTVPSNIISSSISQIYYKQATVYYNEEKNRILYLKTRSVIFKLFLITAFLSLLGYSFLPDIFSFVFGKDWREAGVISQYLLIYIVPSFIISPFTQIFLVTRKNKFLLLTEILRFLLLIVLYVLGKIYTIPIYDFLVYFSLIHCLFYIIIAVPILYSKSFIWK